MAKQIIYAYWIAGYFRVVLKVECFVRAAGCADSSVERRRPDYQLCAVVSGVRAR